MASYLVKTLLLVCATILATVNGEKMDFNYQLEASATVCFLEHIGESVQGKQIGPLLECKLTRIQHSNY